MSSKIHTITCEVCGKTYEYEVKGDGSPHPYQDELMGYCGEGAEPIHPEGRPRGRSLKVRRRNRTRTELENH